MTDPPSQRLRERIEKVRDELGCEVDGLAGRGKPEYAQGMLRVLHQIDRVLAENAALAAQCQPSRTGPLPPYPTPDAYEAVCAARTKWQARAEKAEAALAAQEVSPSQSVEGLRLPVVEGHTMIESIQGFEHRCRVQIARLQEAAYPDRDSIAIIAQAVRCAREYQTSRDLHAQKIKEASPQPEIALAFKDGWQMANDSLHDGEQTDTAANAWDAYLAARRQEGE